MTTLFAYANIRQPYPFAQLPAALIPDYLQQIPHANARVQQRHQCRRLAHFLLYQLLQQANVDVQILKYLARSATGRPFFPVNGLDFNMSHSDDWVAVALHMVEHGQSAVGIDIEFPKKTRNFTALLQHFAAPSEQEWFAQQDGSEAAFYQIWCGREALLKSQGVGIVKLSEVCHDPIGLQLHSTHCPPGQLLFSAELPFYLALFISSFPFVAHHVSCLAWNGEKFIEKDLHSPLIYAVNKNKNILPFSL
ncbi:4'-phosphopantetheinyl transferase family protein [[Pasteurella] aerogenes]|nr:4'-phosphopantetheinyl transferase superfamily protein [[Pasteurella] aerogenes]MDY2795783.1 4'-phosphopantetheinyl transferase superfamily protein [[Pasteurella] aerogenes]VEG71500.1 putative 4'-phosphopantetheinyl transferase [[Pasteurella] aerogenes]